MGRDVISKALYRLSSDPLSVSVEIGSLTPIMQFSIEDEFIRIGTIGDGYTDPNMAGNYTIVITLDNFLG